MFGSLLKGLLFLIVSGSFAFGTIYLTGLSGYITVNLNGSELTISILIAIAVMVMIFLLFFLVVAILNFGVAVTRFLSGDETAISRYFNKSRQIKGNQALSKALISFHEGDSVEALIQSGRAKNLLKNNLLSLLINSQIAKKAGNSRLVMENYKKLLGMKDTRLLALSGIVSEKVKAGDYGSALILAKKSVHLNPKNINSLNTVFNLQIHEKDWKGARISLQAKKKYEKSPNSKFLRQDAILMFAEAKEKRSQGFTKEALQIALTAVRQYPSFVAALSFLTELELMSGNKKRIEKLLQKGWALFPHPDIAKSFAALVKEEGAKDRRVRFEVLTKIKDTEPPTILLEIELCLAERDFSGAKKLILKLEKEDFDSYAHTLMAAIERGLGASESVVREWLTKAVYAPKSFTWICAECGFQSEWDGVCSNCHRFDSMEWRRPTSYAENNVENRQIPFILEIGDNVAPNVEQNTTESIEISEDGIQENMKIDTVKQAREVS